MSSGSLLADAREALEGYLAGRVKAERVVVAVAEAYYKGRETRGTLQPVVEVIERAAPGIVALGRIEGGAGFEIKLAERPFPKSYEAQLRTAAEAALRTDGETPAVQRDGLNVQRETSSVQREASNVQRETPSKPGFFSRVLGAVRRLFSASA